MNTVLLAFLLAMLNGASIIFLSLSMGGLMTPLLFGFIAGIFVGDPTLGLSVGATCTLMSLGFYTYGGATTPNYIVGAMFGVVIAQKSGDITQGIVIGSIIALLMSWFDILGRMATTVFQHAGDKALANRSIPAFERAHILGTSTWFLGRFIPVFFGMLFIDGYDAINTFIQNYAWLQLGLAAVGKALPAVGFALLLSYQDIKRYWPFMILGYSLFAFMKVPTLGLAIIGIAAGAIFIMYGDKNSREEA